MPKRLPALTTPNSTRPMKVPLRQTGEFFDSGLKPTMLV